MDNTEKPSDVPTGISFCSGYGGLERGLERAVGEVQWLAHVEIEAYAIANLVDKMETEQMVPSLIYTDVKTFPSELFRGKIDFLLGGYPCQPFSVAGSRKGNKDPRHLWPYFRRAIDIIRPRIVFFENVEGHVRMGLREVIADLVGLGYRVESDDKEPSFGIFSAEECGAPHKRKRVFIVANSCSKAPRRLSQPEKRDTNIKVRQPSKRGREQELADSCESRLQRRILWWTDKKREGEHGHAGRSDTSLYGRWPSRPREQQHRWEEPRTI